MPKSVLEAISQGQWDFEPANVESGRFAACDAMPGTPAKVAMLAARIQNGLPLWHAGDRRDLDSPPIKRPR